MHQTNPLSERQVVAVRYSRSHYLGGRHRALEAYLASGVYKEAGVPVDVAEPRILADDLGEEDPVTRGALCGAIARVVDQARRAGKAILVTGSNCHSAPGVLGGLQDAHGAGARIGLVWFDAHGDFNTPRTTLSGCLGGMPVAVCAGLALPAWREAAHLSAPLPTDRLVMTDLRNLDPPEKALLEATDAVVVDLPGLGHAVDELAARVDMIYLHIDADILDEAYVPSHRTREPGGPSMAEVSAAIEMVMATSKVVAYAVVSVYFGGQDAEVDLASGVSLVRAGLRSWQQHGMPQISH
jgi:arginase